MIDRPRAGCDPAALVAYIRAQLANDPPPQPPIGPGGWAARFPAMPLSDLMPPALNDLKTLIPREATRPHEPQGTPTE